MAACERPSLAVLVSRLRVSEREDGCVEIEAEAGKQAMVEANLVEIKTLFRRVMSRADVEVVLLGDVRGDAQSVDAGPATQTPLPRTAADTEFDHPLVKSVAEIFDAQPRRIEPKGRRS